MRPGWRLPAPTLRMPLVAPGPRAAGSRISDSRSTSGAISLAVWAKTSGVTTLPGSLIRVRARLTFSETQR